MIDAWRLLPLAAAAALAACASPERAPQAALTPTDQYPLQASPRPQEIRLAPHAEGLSSAQAAALAELAARWRVTGGGEVLIREPLKGADAKAVQQTGLSAGARLIALGVPAERLRRVGYDPQGQAPAPVIVSYTTYEASVPRCGRDWENLTANGQNRPMQNFGCAIGANMAAQIADPADIAGPRAEDPADAVRRTTVLGKYQQGQPTGSDDHQSVVNVSGVATGGGN
jgi:pilus assembly protein CpaD